MGRKSTSAVVAPPLEANLASVKAFSTWTAEALSAGKIEPVVARELTQVARTMIQTIRTEHGLDEMEQLRDLLRRAEEAAAGRKQNEVNSRFAGSQVGEFTVTDEQDEKN